MEEGVEVPVIEVAESVALTADGGNVAADEITSKERDKRFHIS